MNTEAAEILASALEQDASDQESGKIKDLGMRYDEVENQLLPIEEDINKPIYGLAFIFWDDWCDAANHEWQYHEPIKPNEWPIFAREIAASLRAGVLPTNPKIIENFYPKPKVSLFNRIKAWFSESNNKKNV
ncbi:MAG: hypothetical protein ABIK92_18105 [Pseudomonadota bacterium]